MLQPNPTITILCSTIGRESLKDLIASFHHQDRLDGDRLWIMGDGWEEPWISGFVGDGVEFWKCPKAEFYGHRNVWNAVKQVKTDYWGWLGDDDMLAENAFANYRSLLDGRCVVGRVFEKDVQKNFSFRVRSSIPGRIAIAGWQAIVPSAWDIPDFSKMADTDMFDELLFQHSHRAFRWETTQLWSIIRNRP